MTKIGCKRTEPKIGLKRSKGLNKMSDKAKVENKVWQKIKKERKAKLAEKFGLALCEYCQFPTNTYHPLNHADCHHNDWERRHNTFENARIVHRQCHTFIHDHNIKDVPSLL